MTKLSGGLPHTSMRPRAGDVAESRKERGLVETIDKQRRTFIGGALATLALSQGRAKAQGGHVPPNDPFIVLLNGIYQPVPKGGGPAGNLGLTTVNLSDGTYSRTEIYPVYGMPESREQGTAIGHFYPQVTFAGGVLTFNGPLVAYDLPGGAIVMQFILNPTYPAQGYNTFVPFPDGAGGYYLEGTFELNIIEATGVYSSFKGGHNHMVDKLHQLANGSFDEFCFCNISQYPFP